MKRNRCERGALSNRPCARDTHHLCRTVAFAVESQQQAPAPRCAETVGCRQPFEARAQVDRLCAHLGEEGLVIDVFEHRQPDRRHQRIAKMNNPAASYGVSQNSAS